MRDNQTDLTGKIPFKENLKNIKSLFFYVYHIDRGAFLLPALKLLLDAVKRALSVVLSAEILERLFEGAAMEEILKPAVLLLSVTFVLTMVCIILQQEWIGPKRSNVRRVYDGNLAAKYQTMDFSLLESPYVAELKTRIMRDNNWGAGLNDLFYGFDGIVGGVSSLICSFVVAIPILKIMIESGNPWLYLGFAVLVILIRFLTVSEAKAEAAYNKTLLDDVGLAAYPMDVRKEYANFRWLWLSRCIGGDYHFIKEIHLYDGYDMMEKYTVENYREEMKLTRWTERMVSFSGRMGFLSGMNGGLMSMGGYLFSAYYAMMGAFPIGSVIKFADSLTNIFTSAQNVDKKFHSLCLTARKQISTMKMLELGDEMYKGKLPVEKRLDNRYEIEFRNVSFRYPGTETYALKDFSLKLRIGEKMAIVGMNGSGKTTMIKLLCRLYDPEEGQILLNGVDIRKFSREEYIRLFSVVFQDFSLLSMPLGQNVAASVEVDGERAEEALRQAGLYERLQELPRGLDTYLYQNIEDEGVEISGGEAQKIAIARALYKDAPFVLLDEPTASLDPLSEYEIYSGFDTMVKDKTAIYISHRLSSCRFCSDIAVLHEGRLVQRGSHEELLADPSGKYYELWNAQAQYYREEQGAH